MEKLKSTIKKNSEIDYSQEFELNRLQADKNFVEFQRKKIKEIMPNETAENIDKQVANIVARNNSVDLIIQGIYKHFDININNDDVKSFADRIKNNVLNNKNENM